MIRAGLSMACLRQANAAYSSEHAHYRIADPDVAEMAASAGLPPSLFAVRKASVMLQGGMPCELNGGWESLNRFCQEMSIRQLLLRLSNKEAEWDKEMPQFADLADASKRKVPTSSGGMKRRLSNARAMVHNPSFILLDEPTVGFDAHARRRVRDLIRRLREEVHDYSCHRTLKTGHFLSRQSVSNRSPYRIKTIEI